MNENARNHIKKAFGLLFVFAFMSSLAHARPKYIPVVMSEYGFGQWYFDGDESSLGGNAEITFIPALQYSNRFSVIPTFSSKYRGTRSVQELAGGNTLFQDTWENEASVKAVHGLGSNWKIRERMGYRFKWFRETTDESFSDGLYDYDVLFLGGEVERKWGKRAALAFGYDFSLLRFPNYQSLESTQSGDLSREYVGKNPLDTDVHLLSMRGKIPSVWGIQNRMQFYYSPRFYTDQTVVLNSGLLAATKRKDTFVGLNLNMDRNFALSLKKNIGVGLFYSYTGVDSNQNHYDARLTHFVGDFYDYGQQQIGMSVSYSLARNPIGVMVFDISGLYSIRDYSDRVTQDRNGAYRTSKLYQEESALSFGIRYPLSKNFNLKTTATLGKSRSNNDYEAVYRYNYTNANYLFGFTYEY